MKPMLAKSADPMGLGCYVTDDEWWAQQKLDGERALTRVEGGVPVAFGRDGRRRSKPLPCEVARRLSELPGTWWLDGELLDGVLWLFDVPVAPDELVGTATPYVTRYGALERFFKAWEPEPWVRLVPVRYEMDDKAALVRDLYMSRAEGVMLRHVDGCYAPGVRSPRMLKAKFTNTVDAVVTAVGVEGKDNCAYKVYGPGGEDIEIGACSLHGKARVKEGDVIELKYLYVVGQRLVQPRLLRVRDDKPAEECTVDQLHFTDKHTVHEPQGRP